MARLLRTDPPSHDTALERAARGGDRIGFLLLPQFALLPFFACLETLRVANRAAGRALFDWALISADGRPVTASNGMRVEPDRALDQASADPTLFVCAGYAPDPHVTGSLKARLRRLDRHGAVLGGIDTGGVVLAETGLLDGYSATVHWEATAAFQARYPRVRAVEDLYTIDRKRITCAGGFAAGDMTLSLIALRHGQDLADSVAELLAHGETRPAEVHQRAAGAARLDRRDPRVGRLVATMERHLEDPLDADALARTAGLSRRQMHRLCRRHLRATPQGYYLSLRLERAQQLVTQTGRSLGAVAAACGFSSQAVFARAYRRRFGVAPSDARRSFRTGPTGD
jgi:AraC family carnitine catabolism transcriptional activator